MRSNVGCMVLMVVEEATIKLLFVASTSWPLAPSFSKRIFISPWMDSVHPFMNIMA